ncbi:ATP-binding protein [Roseibium alexandrii]|jgi:signal transduction histidine kinase|uniref:histidine kinase n=2 Tax=Roseibium alexandrii TaxID=388408 RepID=A0A0M7AP34_9HYPH|nr:ATP-binding protein [Roseibium alexandrii]EEE47828.1 Signal transduction histidine kinase [Roseibium alexandrii DFL-11]CTQ76281.1 Osmolarity sensor protein EnvZ [Roseibium alexandrii]
MSASSPRFSVLRRLWPRNLASQLILLLLAAIVVVQAISIYIFHDERRIALVALARDSILARAVSIAELLEETPPYLHSRVLEASSTRYVAFWTGEVPLAKEPGKSRFEQRVQNYAARQLGSERTIHINLHSDEKRGPSWRSRVDGGKESWRDVPKSERPRHLKRVMNKPEDLSLSILLNDGSWLNMATSYRPPPGAFIPLVVQLSLMGLAIIGIVAFAVRRVTRPLRGLADAAGRLGRGEDVDSLPETGPSEVRAVTIAFNEMQERLTRFVRDRTRMLAAISHDLRTPITSLRLRAEFIDDEENRTKMIETLDDMAAMAEAALRFAKDDASQEPAEKADLGALLESLADDQQDLGHACEVDVEERIVLSCRPLSLKRAFRNLIENGIRYGGSVKITAKALEADVIVEIHDQGPGIPEDRLADVFEPFVRLEESRSEETGGIGLGLAIARSIIHAHGGTITLSNVAGTGLRVEVRLPKGN